MHKYFLTWAALFGVLAVALGAFGAHSLKEILPPSSLATFETGVKYQFYHTFALLASGVLYERFPGKWLRSAGYCFIAGIILFSGSLYVLAFLVASGNVGLRNVGIVTPIGGLFFIAGWIFLLLGIWMRPDDNASASSGKRI